MYSRIFFKTISILLVCICIVSAGVKNVILLIGDGMGLVQLTSARLSKYGVNGSVAIEELPVTGLIKTHSANAVVTDSAAAGTALAAGFKTNNGMISVTPDGKKVLTILEACKLKGMATGLVATSEITHATPASFGSHVKSRKEEILIAEHLLENRIDVMLGGGRRYFLPKSNGESKRDDDKDLLSLAEDMGYQIISKKKEMKKIKEGKLLGLFRLEAVHESSSDPSIAELTEKAIDLLSRDTTGFFLMVEASQIDWECHANDAKDTMRKVLLFDEAVKIAVKFAEKNKETIVIVTADHETGGMSIESGGTLAGENLDLDWTTNNHTGVPVPLFAYGPGAEGFTGLYNNTEVPKKIAGLLGIEDFPSIIEE